MPKPVITQNLRLQESNSGEGSGVDVELELDGLAVAMQESLNADLVRSHNRLFPFSHVSASFSSASELTMVIAQHEGSFGCWNAVVLARPSHFVIGK